MKKNLLLFFLLFLFFFENVFAQQADLLNFLRGIAYALCLLFVVLGGYDIVTSEGDPGKMEEGKKKVIYALIGLGLALSVETIVDLMKQ